MEFGYDATVKNTCWSLGAPLEYVSATTPLAGADRHLHQTLSQVGLPSLRTRIV